MSVERYTAENAPGFAKHASSFKNDDRCYEVDFVTGPDYDEVWTEIIKCYGTGEGYSDLDVNFSTEGDCYVGITCRDYDKENDNGEL